jgi:hypothetical protein
MSNWMGFWSLLGQSKLEDLTLFQDVNHEGVDTVLVMAAQYNCLVEDAHMGFTYITLRNTASVIRNQWGVRIQDFKVWDLLGDC